MAIPRHPLSDTGEQSGSTNTPSRNDKKFEVDETTEVSKLGQAYEQEDTGSTGQGFNTGAMLPRDMTVKLVRADNSQWETFLSVGYSISLTLFGLFLGSWLNSDSFSRLETVSIFAFALISLLLLGIWVGLKVQQQRNSIKVPYDVLNHFSKSPNENDCDTA